ncbi:MAG: hypothetical protein KAG37_00405, partial [Flavobacteriales bacterium]|nr:hypothetical protein [Flavobacteriales bacterium]
PPVYNVESGDFNKDGDNWLVKFNETTGAYGGADGNGWEYITSLTESVNLGEGLSVYRGAYETLEFKEKIHTIDLAISLDWTDTSHGYNLIGNPFTSALLWDGTADWALTKVNNSIWIWDGTQYLSSPGGLTNHNIALGQAFFVRANDAGASITLPASKRNHNTSTFSKKNKNSGRNYVIINADNNGNKDVAYVYFDATGTEGYDDGYDATKMIGSNDAPQLYTVQSGMDLTYNFLPTLDSSSDKIIPLNYIPGTSGNQKLSFDLTNLVGMNIFIEDLITSDIQNLASNNVYNFTGSKDDRKDRFSLRFSAKGSLSDVDEVVSEINVFSTGNVINIKSTNKAVVQSGTVYIYDISGREILRKEIGDTKIIQIPISSAK